MSNVRDLNLMGNADTLIQQEEPGLYDMLFLIFNFAACVPVWMCVGLFSLYHLYLASGNSTTVEGWEKDKVATLIRRGKIKDVKYPYVSPSQYVEHWFLTSLRTLGSYGTSSLS